jgi:phosphatidylglycerol:prolipoprotein diacylglycerol transferase
MAKNALVPTPDLVQPTPVYEFLFAMVLAWWLWKRQSKARPLGFITGEYLVLSGIARFLVEFVRINPHVYGPFSNAQVAAAITVIVGSAIMFATRNNPAIIGVPLPPKSAEPETATAS